MFDPEEVAPSDTSSQDASKPGFQKAWNAWTSKPENNAALLQFGISMLQPRAPGQSGIGSIANSIGEAGGAAGRVEAQQQAEELQAANIADKEAQRENQATTAESGRITANAYDYGIRNPQLKAGGGLTPILRAQNTFRAWAAKASDPFAAQLDPEGNSAPPFVRAIRKAHPEIKDNSEIASNPRYAQEAVRLLAAQEAAINGEGEAEGTIPSEPAGAPPTPQGPRIIYDAKGQPFNWDGIQGHPPVPVKR